MFKCNPNNSGFHIKFENGWTVSVQWGPHNYADNYYSANYADIYYSAYDVTGLPSLVAEIAAWDADRNWYEFEDDNVKGYVKPEEVAEFIAMVANL